MANWTAIAAVTATLESSIRATLVGKVLNPTVTTGKPRQPRGANQATVNLFLYAMSPNASYRNEELPVRNTAGEFVHQPVLAIDLFYLVSFLGAQDGYIPELLAGAVLTEFHSAPFLSGDRIADAVAEQLALDVQAFGLAMPDLDGQEYRIGVNPMRLTTEETTNLWSALGADFSTTLALEVSVVLLEPELPEPRPAPALPVRKRDVHVVPTRGPTISDKKPLDFPYDPVGTFRILGSGFDAPNIVVNISGREVTPVVVSPNELQTTVPGGTPAGFRAVRVIQQIEMGDPPSNRPVLDSNTVVLIVRPSLTLSGSIATGDAEATVAPFIESDQDASLLLSRRGPGPPVSEDRPIDIPGPLGVVPIPQGDLISGDYFVRIRVDGAESSLEVDADGVPVGPLVTVP